MGGGRERGRGDLRPTCGRNSPQQTGDRADRRATARCSDAGAVGSGRGRARSVSRGGCRRGGCTGCTAACMRSGIEASPGGDAGWRRSSRRGTEPSSAIRVPRRSGSSCGRSSGPIHLIPRCRSSSQADGRDSNSTARALSPPATSPAATASPSRPPRARSRTSAAKIEPHLFRRALRQAELAGHRVPHLSAVKRTRSDLELLFLALCDDHGLPRPLVNHRVHGRLVDFFFAEQRLAVETDSWEYHRGSVAFEDDHDRDLALRAHRHHHPPLHRRPAGSRSGGGRRGPPRRARRAS